MRGSRSFIQRGLNNSDIFGGGENQLPLKADHNWSASEMLLMMAQH